MAMKRGKELTAKKLARRATKKAKRYSRRWDSRAGAMAAYFSDRDRAHGLNERCSICTLWWGAHSDAAAVVCAKKREEERAA